MRLFLAVAVLLAGCGSDGKKEPVVPVNPDPDPSSAKGSGDPPIAGIRATELESGDMHTCAICSDGEVRCWGDNGAGQSAGSEAMAARPTVVAGVKGATDLATAGQFSCVVMPDKSVMCWGTGKILGDGKSVEKAPPTKVSGVADAMEVEADGVIACALLASGHMKCWGLEMTLPNLTDVTEFDVGLTHGCALRKDKTVTCWGVDEGWGGKGGAQFAKPAVKDVEHIAVGDNAAFTLTGGVVRGWGRNMLGELGMAPDADDHVKLVEIKGIPAVVEIQANEGHACGITADRVAHCWGTNRDGDLARGTKTDSETPGVLKLPGRVRDVTFGIGHGCALLEDGSVHCWGGNKFGQIGDGSTTPKTSPVRITL